MSAHLPLDTAEAGRLPLQFGQRDPAGALQFCDPEGSHEIFEVVELGRRTGQHDRERLGPDVDDLAFKHLDQLDDLAATSTTMVMRLNRSSSVGATASE
jgi:hypothetical protein